MTNALEQGLALDDLAQHLYDFLPGTPHPYADKDLSFPGVARELGLSQYWQGGSKQPAIRKMLEGVLNSGTGRFSPLIMQIVQRSMTRRKRSDPITREEIERLNALLIRLSVKIPELHSAGFLTGFRARGNPVRRLRRSAYRRRRWPICKAAWQN